MLWAKWPMLSLSEATPLRSFFSKMLLANQPIRSMPELNLRTVQKIRCLGDGEKKVLLIRSWFIRDKNRRKAFRSHRMDQARACQISPAILKFRPDIIIAFQPESACCITQYFMDRPPIITMMHASPAAFLKHPQTAFLAESDLTVVLLNTLSKCGNSMVSLMQSAYPMQLKSSRLLYMKV